MSQEPLVTEEMIARQPPEAQAIIRLLLAKLAELEARLNKSPRNSSLPPPASNILTPNPLQRRNTAAGPAASPVTPSTSEPSFRRTSAPPSLPSG